MVDGVNHLKSRQEELRASYAAKAMDQIPRLLGNLDRNPFSQTYGCFHRDYWLDKTSDFPDAVRQFGAHALALVYSFQFPDNPYYQNQKMLDWVIAGLLFWAKIQHKDGSFDEFYPNERGWVGPTAFTTYTSIESFRLIQDKMSTEDQATVIGAIKKSAYFIGCGESEEDHLANHHAMACLAIWKSYELLKDEHLKSAFENAWKTFLEYHTTEGWSREYDGIDPGYLSATVSFLSKIYQTNPDPAIKKVIDESIEMCSYFVYPNGFYAGSLGSRNTLHFYPHGFEIFSKENALASNIAEKMLLGLSQNKLVPPGIMSDRYVFYRVPELLLSYLDYSKNTSALTPLPYERGDFHRYFEKSKIWVVKQSHYYIACNLSKGGVIKVFDVSKGELITNDCGVLGESEEGKLFTSQWIHPKWSVEATAEGWKISGPLQAVPTQKLFTPFKNIIFRVLVLCLGWNSTLAHMLKGFIRKSLILGSQELPVTYSRTFTQDKQRLLIQTQISVPASFKIKRLMVGDEFFVRYVPQSRYFQQQELSLKGHLLGESELEDLRRIGSFTYAEEINLVK